MENQVEETGQELYRRLKAEAKKLGITGNMNTEALKKAIADKKAGIVSPPKEEGLTGITSSEAKSIEARLRFEEETRDKIRSERQLITDIAQITAESESQCIPITLPENPTELDLARARETLKIKKTEVKPSPETLAIEAGKRGYYIFTNREQEDAKHTTCLGGKYFIDLVPDQIHVLSDFHIRFWKKHAVVPQYERVSTGVVAGPNTTGQVVEKSQRVKDKPRFIFEFVGEAPQDAPFGLVTDTKILDELTVK